MRTGEPDRAATIRAAIEMVMPRYWATLAITGTSTVRAVVAKRTRAMSTWPAFMRGDARSAKRILRGGSPVATNPASRPTTAPSRRDVTE